MWNCSYGFTHVIETPWILRDSNLVRDLNEVLYILIKSFSNIAASTSFCSGLWLIISSSSEQSISVFFSGVDGSFSKGFIELLWEIDSLLFNYVFWFVLLYLVSSSPISVPLSVYRVASIKDTWRILFSILVTFRLYWP